MTTQSPAPVEGGVILELMGERESAENELEIGRSIVERIRSETNREFAYFQGDEDEDVFHSIYLTERDGCLPLHLVGDELLLDIRHMYYEVFDAIREELIARNGRGAPIWIAVDPSYEDSTFSVMCTEEQVLLLHWSKAWNFFWPGEEAMAADVGRMYNEAAKRLRGAAERRDEPGV